MRLVPRRYRSAYFPRIPPEKSYSGRIFEVVRLERVFFVFKSFMLRSGTSADKADAFSSDSVNLDREPALTRHQDDSASNTASRFFAITAR
jgi:hypothetical protein